jgi:hypothetical protein
LKRSESKDTKLFSFEIAAAPAADDDDEDDDGEQREYES